MQAWLLAVTLWLQTYAGAMLPAELAPEADPRGGTPVIWRQAAPVSTCPARVAP